MNPSFFERLFHIDCYSENTKKADEIEQKRMLLASSITLHPNKVAAYFFNQYPNYLEHLLTLILFVVEEDKIAHVIFFLSSWRRPLLQLGLRVFFFSPLAMIFFLPAAYADGNTTRSPLQSSAHLGMSQEKGKIFQKVLKNNANEPVSIRISLSAQRLFLFLGNQLAISSPISSGRRSGWTPVGKFKILEKDPAHRSNLYGNFVDRENRIIRSGVDARRDSAPSGTHFQGAPMLYFMRLTDRGVGMHVGLLPGYPASHGCIRLPEEMAKVIYEVTPMNTEVTIEE